MLHRLTQLYVRREARILVSMYRSLFRPKLRTGTQRLVQAVPCETLRGLLIVRTLTNVALRNVLGRR
jgi:hypothetical protein